MLVMLRRWRCHVSKLFIVLELQDQRFTEIDPIHYEQSGNICCFELVFIRRLSDRYEPLIFRILFDVI